MFSQKIIKHQVNSKKNNKYFTFVLFSLLGIAIISLISCAFFVKQTINAIKMGELDLASKSAKQAKFLPQILSYITFGQIADIELVNTSLNLISNLPEIKNSINPLETASQVNNPNLLKTTNSDLQKLDQAFARSFTKKRMEKNVAEQIQYLVHDLSLVFDFFVSEKLHLLVIFQNNQEIRATGGFMGSYADVFLQKGTISEIVFHDIYEAEGLQISQTNPPVGVQKYLSEKGSWRLPDANWSPDFPSSAEQIQQFFIDAKQPQSDLLVVINLDTVESILQVLGDVYLPDYQTTVNAQNFAEIARSDRSSFFPGSHQKTNFISAAFTAIKQKIVESNREQQLKIVEGLAVAVHSKSLQIYSSNTAIQQILQSRGLAGQMDKNPYIFEDFRAEKPTNKAETELEPIYLFLVESNVGINKANQEIFRSVQLNINQGKFQIDLQFKNNNLAPTSKNQNPYIKQADHLGYVNYQRIFLNPDAIVKFIKIDNQQVTSWEEKIVQSKNRQFFKEIGFILTVPEQKSNHVQVLLDIGSAKINPLKMTIQKQSGIPPTTYTITKEQKIFSQEISRDAILDLQRKN